jgi:hypothetical protein
MHKERERADVLFGWYQRKEYGVGVTVRVGKWGRNNTLVSEDRPDASDVDNMRAHTHKSLKIATSN